MRLGRALVGGEATALVMIGANTYRLIDFLPAAPGVGAGELDLLFADWERFGHRLEAMSATGYAIGEEDIGAFLAPLERPSHLICIGTNYHDHVAEMGVSTSPQFPYAFLKPRTTIAPPAGPVRLPAMSTMVDWEAELGVVIGARAHNVSLADALSVVAGYLPLNDISARDWIASRPALGIDWVMQKGHDTFTPLGPWITLASAVPDPQSLPVECRVNGVVVQQSFTSNMIFSVAQIIVHLSAIMTLSPGDIIATGTPAGVGFGRKPPVFLESGDVVTTSIGLLGSFDTKIIDASGAHAAAT